MDKKLKTQDGFTLIEVVVAIVIITALVATFAPLIVSSVERIQWAGQRTQALYTIRGTMEKAIAAGTTGDGHSFTIRGQEFVSETEYIEFTGIATGKLVIVKDGSLKLVTFLVPMAL